MIEPDRPLRLDAPREEALEHAVKLVTEAWRSFDRFRPEEPVLGERVRSLLETSLPQEPASVHEALDDTARILDESIAQPRPRYFAFIGSSGLEIGTIADLLAHTYDINLAVDARAATQIERQAVRWAAEFIGYPTECAGAFTSGGTVSNTSALAAAREFALPGSRLEGLAGRRVAVYCSQEVHYSITRAIEMLGIGSRNLRVIPLDEGRGMRPDLLARAIDEDRAEGVTPVAVVIVVLVAGGGDGKKSSGPEAVSAGCVAQSYPSMGRNHVLEVKPDFEYNSFPATSGPHYPETAIYNAYGEPVPQIRLLHNLEHGAVIVQYGDKVAPSAVDELIRWYRDDPNGIIVAPLPELGGKIAATAWTQLLTCSQGFDEKAFSDFRDSYRYKGPERFDPNVMVPGSQ